MVNSVWRQAHSTDPKADTIESVILLDAQNSIYRTRTGSLTTQANMGEGRVVLAREDAVGPLGPERATANR